MTKAHTMQKLLSVLALTILCGSMLFGQDLEEEAALQGRITYELEGQDITLKAQVQNTTESEVILGFDFFLSGKDKKNNEISYGQDGQAKLSADEARVLVTKRMGLQGLESFEAIFQVYFQDILMDSDTLVYSAEKQEEKNEYQEDISQEVDYEGQQSGFEFGGFIIDNTRTRAGRELYDLFYSKWEAPSGAGDFFIKLEEFPGRGLTTRLVVWLDDDKVVETNLRPNYDYLEGLAGYVNARLQRILLQRIETGKNLSDDLQGIY